MMAADRVVCVSGAACRDGRRDRIGNRSVVRVVVMTLLMLVVMLIGCMLIGCMLIVAMRIRRSGVGVGRADSYVGEPSRRWRLRQWVIQRRRHMVMRRHPQPLHRGGDALYRQRNHDEQSNDVHYEPLHRPDQPPFRQRPIESSVYRRARSRKYIGQTVNRGPDARCEYGGGTQESRAWMRFVVMHL